MKIWLIQANEPIPYVDKGQRPFRTGMLAEELIKQGHEIVWFSATFDHYTKNQRFRNNEQVNINETSIVQFLYGCEYKKNISIKRIYNHIQIARNFKRINKVYEKPDLIYCSIPTIYLAKAAIDYGEKNNVKVIIDVRDLWPEVFERAIPSKVQWLVKPLFSKLHNLVNEIYKKAYAINGVSTECVDYVMDKSGRKRSDADLGYFIGYPSIYKVKPRNRLKQTENMLKTISFIGTIGSQINYQLIVDVAKKLPENCQIVIGGDGPLMKEFKNMAQDVKNIVFKGWIDKNGIKELLNSSYLSFIPYNNTFDFQLGAGNKFGETLCYAIPPIVMCDGVMENLVKKANCGFYSKDAVGISEYINKLISDNELYEETVVNASDLFENEFDSEKIYVNLVRYIKEIVEAKI